MHSHIDIKQKHFTQIKTGLTINKLSKHVYFLSMSDSTIESDDVGVVELTPYVKLLILIMQNVHLSTYNTHCDQFQHTTLTVTR